VTRDEFSTEVWAGRIVSDEALSRCISVLRQVFADDSREPRFIRTIARIGYTLVPIPLPLAPNRADAVSALPHVVAEIPITPTDIAGPPSITAPPPQKIDWRRPALVTAAGIGLIALVAFFYFPRPLQTPTDAAPPPPPVTRLLVLPFDTGEAGGFGRDLGVELSDQIADSLAHVERVQISGRTSAYTLGASHIGAVEAGRKLGVDAVLNGEIADRPAGVHVSARLTATKDGRVLWTRDYDRQAADVFAAQSSIAASVVRELTGLLDPESLAGAPGAVPNARDPEAYQLYLRGAHQVRLRGEDSLRRAVDLFSAAARRDPAYARAQVGLAYAYALLPSYSYEDPVEMYALAEKAVIAADHLSHNRSESAGARGYLDFMRGQWIDSETAFRTAIVADPNNPDVRQMYSQLLAAVGRIDAALAQVRLAQEIDPLAPVVADRLGILQLWLGHDAEAASDAALARELGLDEVAYPETKILLKFHQHDDADAADGLRNLEGALHRSDEWIGPTIDAYRHAEKRPSTIQLLDRTLAAGGITARIYFGLMVLLESPARALKAFAALPARDNNDLELLFSVDAAAVRRDPEFGNFIRKMGIEAYWNRFGWPGACRREGSLIACH
jgi:TolB-like protein